MAGNGVSGKSVNLGKNISKHFYTFIMAEFRGKI